MRRSYGAPIAAVTVVMIAAMITLRSNHDVSPRPVHVAPPRVTAESLSTIGPVTHPDIGFQRGEQLREHFRKHGRDFGASDARVYERMAQALRDRPAGGDVIEAVRGDGVICRYDRASGAFIAFDSDLRIRTFFKPNDGEAYFKRQMERSH